jgi:hypothetical protein
VVAARLEADGIQRLVVEAHLVAPELRKPSRM